MLTGWLWGIDYGAKAFYKDDCECTAKFLAGKMKRKQPPNAHDKFFKSVFGRPAVAADFLRRYLPTSIVRLLDLTRIELEKDSFIDAKLRQHFSDLLYRVGLASGGEAYLYFLLEHKSEPDKWVGLQLLRYLAQAWEQMRRGGAERLPLIIPVVFYHGAARWEVDEQFRALLDTNAETEELLAYVPGFKHHLCDLSQYADEELEGAGDLAASLRLLKHIFDDDLSLHLSGFFRLVIERMPPPEAKERLETMVEYVIQSDRAGVDEVADALTEAENEGGIMETPIDRWRQEGKLIGRREGREEGKHEEAVAMTLRQLRWRVGRLDRATQDQVRDLSLAQLRRLGKALLDFERRDDLTAWLKRVAARAARKKMTRQNGT